MATNSLLPLSSKGRNYFPSSSLWAVLVTYFDHCNQCDRSDLRQPHLLCFGEQHLEVKKLQLAAEGWQSTREERAGREAQEERDKLAGSHSW